MAATSFTAKIAWRVWRIVFTRDLPKDLDGLCDSPTKEGKPRRGKKIQIRDNLQGKEALETILHESLHAALDCINEEYVEQTASDQANVICHDAVLKRFLNCPAIRRKVLDILNLPDIE